MWCFVSENKDLPIVSSELRSVLRQGSYVMRLLDHGDSLLTTRNLATLNTLANRPLSVSWIARINGFTQAAASQLVNRLEADGLVMRSTDPQDRRGVLVEVTPKGHESRLIEAQRRNSALKEYLQDLNDEELHKLREALPLLNRVFSACIAEWTPPEMIPPAAPDNY